MYSGISIGAPRTLMELPQTWRELFPQRILASHAGSDFKDGTLPIVILILTAIGGAIWWWARNNPREALRVASDAATTLKNAPRRIAFRRQTQEHPVEGIDDLRVAFKK